VDSVDPRQRGLFYDGLAIAATSLLAMGFLTEFIMAIAKHDDWFPDFINSLLLILAAVMNLTGLSCYILWLLIDTLEKERKTGAIGLGGFFAMLVCFFLGLHTTNEFLQLFLHYLLRWLSVVVGLALGFYIIGNIAQMAETFGTTTPRMIPPDRNSKNQKKEFKKK
jgi:hypothetical protein